MLRRLYDRIIELSGHRQALWWLAVVSFVESSFFPVPPDAMVLPMVLARPDRAWRIALVCTVASVVGGLLGYAIGYYAYEAFGHLVVSAQDYAWYQAQYDKWGLWVILAKGLTPIPYKLVTIASGMAQFDLAMFIFASIVTRGARFFVEAALLKRYGATIRPFVEKYLTWVTTGFLVVVIGGILIAKYGF